MVTIDINSVQQICYRRKLLLDIQNVFPKKIRIVCDSYVLYKNVFFHTYILEKYSKDKLKYFSSVHAHRCHVNLRKH